MANETDLNGPQITPDDKSYENNSNPDQLLKCPKTTGPLALLTTLLRRDDEPENPYLNLAFQPGIHPSQQEGEKLFEKLLQQGDPDTHLWNPEVAERLAQMGCKVLCIDGLSFSYVTNAHSGKVIYLAAVNWHIWAGLPDRPRNINSQGRLYVIGGDNMFVEDSFAQGFAQDPERKEEFTKKLGKSERMGSGEGMAKNAIEGKIFGGVSVAVLAFVLYQLHKHQDDTMSRRGFLKFISNKVVPPILLAGLKNDVAVNLIMNGAANATTTEQADIYLNLARLSGPDLIYDDWIRARTASMVLKTKDGLDILQNDPKSGVNSDDSSAIVAGNAHGPEAKGFLGSEERAGKEVFMYAKKMVDAACEVLQATSDVTISREVVIGHVKDHLSQTFIYKVDDPGTDSPDPKFVDNLQNYIKTTYDFKSPRILVALQDLK